MSLPSPLGFRRSVLRPGLAFEVVAAFETVAFDPSVDCCLEEMGTSWVYGDHESPDVWLHEGGQRPSAGK